MTSQHIKLFNFIRELPHQLKEFIAILLINDDCEEAFTSVDYKYYGQLLQMLDLNYKITKTVNDIELGPNTTFETFEDFLPFLYNVYHCIKSKDDLKIICNKIKMNDEKDDPDMNFYKSSTYAIACSYLHFIGKNTVSRRDINYAKTRSGKIMGCFVIRKKKPYSFFFSMTLTSLLYAYDKEFKLWWIN